MKEKRKLKSIDYIFCTDEYLLDINKNYLGHDYYTDIVTFTLSPPTTPIVGEIYISVDRIKENAMVLGLSVNEELHRVIFHGSLHLCGYKDRSILDKKKMTNAEDYYLALYFN